MIMTEVVQEEVVREKISLRYKDLCGEQTAWPNPADLLNRAPEVENLSSIVTSTQGPLVFAIDAPWGGGKTTFINLWRQYLKLQGLESVYLNAWESDFADDPLLPMLVSIDQWLKESKPHLHEGPDWQEAKKLAGKVAKIGLNAGIRLATMGALDASEAVEGVAAEAAAAFSDTVVEEFSERLTALEKFKEKLSVAVSELPEIQENLVIFVDELDRCKPTYAIEVLERIKHLFDLERIVFILSVNKEQLSKSCRGVYGGSFDTDKYLRRFIDFDYSLKTPSISDYIRARLNSYEVYEFFKKNQQASQQQFVDVWAHLAKIFGMTLRDIDRLMTRFRLIISGIAHNEYVDGFVLAALLVLREENKSLYQQYFDEPEAANDAICYLLGVKDIQSIEELPHGLAVLVGCLIEAWKDDWSENTLTNNLLEPWISFSNEGIGEKANKVELARSIDTISSIVNKRSGMRHGSISKLAYDRIELTSQLNF
jgi:hypothetical protein